MEKEDFLRLTEKISIGSATSEEVALYNAYYEALDKSEGAVSTTDTANIEQVLLNQIITEIQKKPTRTGTYKLWYGLTAAAVLLIIAAAVQFFSAPVSRKSVEIGVSKFANDVKPGGNQATLTLANGKKINLTAEKNSTIAEQFGIKITKTANGQLVYSLSDKALRNAKNMEGQFNVIETPAGGQYQVNLPDGTSVWLNAASSLKYPVLFSKKQRRVELSGEGYFEVAKDKNRPFVVATVKQEIEVLGTHFNINSYKDESLSKTTLLEGSVRVRLKTGVSAGANAGLLLVPGQQAVLSGAEQRVIAVDTEEAIAWKNGYFLFNDEDLESIMRKIARWYNVEVHYNQHPGTVHFIGRVSRAKNISTVLNALEKTENVRFKIEGRKVYVL